MLPSSQPCTSMAESKGRDELRVCRKLQALEGLRSKKATYHRKKSMKILRAIRRGKPWMMSAWRSCRNARA